MNIVHNKVKIVQWKSWIIKMDCPNCEAIRRENEMLTLKLNELNKKDHVSKEVGVKDE